MELTKAEFMKISHFLPLQRGNVKHENLLFLNAVLYVAANGCKWRILPEGYGNCNSIYKKANRWGKSGVLDRIFIALQKEQIIQIKIEHVSLGSTSIKVYPNAHGALKKEENNLLEKHETTGTASFMWLPRMIKLL